jgi:threonine aldolase
LYIDGARPGYGLMARECDFDMAWLAQHCDTFYIGGTKVGALCGEAVVFPKGNEPRLFQTIIKRHGAMLAKSRLAGVQFDALFTDNLYFNISRYAIQKAMQLRELFVQAGLTPLPSPTNQQFVVLNEQQRQIINDGVAYEIWGTIDKQRTTCRFVTSWATTEADMQQLADVLARL